MAKEFDRVKFSISGSPGTGTVTIGTRSDISFFLPAEQGAVDGDKVYYVIQKANKDTEVGVGTIATGVTEVTRDTVLSSIVSGVAGTSKINVDGAAFMAFVTPALALKSLRTVRTVTGTTDTLADGDGMGQITYNSASAVAVTLPQAGASVQFLKGWLCFVRNTAAGAVTITPTTSTINGSGSLALANGDSAMIVSDGTNYTAIVWAAPSGVVRYDASQTLTATQRTQAQANIGVSEITADVLAVASSEATEKALFLFDETSRFADGFETLTFVNTAGATNLDTSTSGVLKNAMTAAAAISGATGTSFGKSSAGAAPVGGGLAAAFDGTTNQVNSSSCAFQINITSAYVGKNYSGSPKKISQAVVYGSNNDGYVNASNPSVTLSLYGKNGSAPANGTDGTLLGSTTFTDTGNESGLPRTITSSNTTTAWDYVWVNADPGGTVVAIYFAEVTFWDAPVVGNITVSSGSFGVPNTPTNARIVVQVKEVSSITLNTDFVSYVSRDAGTTYTPFTLTKAYTDGYGFSVYQSNDLDISGQPAGATMQWKIVTANNKSVEINGVCLKWR